MNKLRLSSTLINYYLRNETEDLYYYYVGVAMPKTKYMTEGSMYDEKNNESIRANSKMIPEFGGFELSSKAMPQLKMEKEVDFNDGICIVELVGVVDCWDPETKILWEVKTGVKSSSEYLFEHQVLLYNYLLHLSGERVEAIRVVRYNQYFSETDWSEMKVQPDYVERAERFIGEIYQPIYNILLEKGVFDS